MLPSISKICTRSVLPSEALHCGCLQYLASILLSFGSTLALRAAQHSSVLQLALGSSINVHFLRHDYLMQCIECRMLNECNDVQRLRQHMQRGPAEVW